METSSVKFSTKDKESYLISNVFNIRNVLIYILTILISMISVSLDNTEILFIPFSLALIAASISTAIPAIGVVVSCLIRHINLTEIFHIYFQTWHHMLFLLCFY